MALRTAILRRTGTPRTPEGISSSVTSGFDDIEGKYCVWSLCVDGLILPLVGVGSRSGGGRGLLIFLTDDSVDADEER